LFVFGAQETPDLLALTPLSSQYTTVTWRICYLFRKKSPKVPKTDPTKLNIVLAYKDSRLHTYTKVHPHQNIKDLLAQEDISVDQLQKAHEAHLETLKHVETILQDLKYKYKKAYRGRLAGADISNSLVITVGGDGTLLEASHQLNESIILGVNSDPGRSTGSLCIADQNSFESIFTQFLHGELKAAAIPRLQLMLDEQPIGVPVLNDILIAHKNPGATSRFILKTKQQQQDIRSSGVWIAGPAGSTGAILSAGGQIADLSDKRIQVRVREPCASHENNSRWSTHFLEENAPLEVISRMREGMIYMDGPHLTHRFSMGSRLSIHTNANPLSLLISDDMQSRRLKWQPPS
jgi:NAD+ kinase